MVLHVTFFLTASLLIVNANRQKLSITSVFSLTVLRVVDVAVSLLYISLFLFTFSPTPSFLCASWFSFLVCQKFSFSSSNFKTPFIFFHFPSIYIWPYLIADLEPVCFAMFHLEYYYYLLYLYATHLIVRGNSVQFMASSRHKFHMRTVKYSGIPIFLKTFY